MEGTAPTRATRLMGEIPQIEVTLPSGKKTRINEPGEKAPVLREVSAKPQGLWENSANRRDFNNLVVTSQQICRNLLAEMDKEGEYVHSLLDVEKIFSTITPDDFSGRQGLIQFLDENDQKRLLVIREEVRRLEVKARSARDAQEASKGTAPKVVKNRKQLEG